MEQNHYENFLEIMVDVQKKLLKTPTYCVFHQFRQAKFDKGGSILSHSQFLLLPQLPQKNEAHFKSSQN